MFAIETLAVELEGGTRLKLEANAARGGLQVGRKRHERHGRKAHHPWPTPRDQEGGRAIPVYGPGNTKGPVQASHASSRYGALYFHPRVRHPRPDGKPIPADSLRC